MKYLKYYESKSSKSIFFEEYDESELNVGDIVDMNYVYAYYPVTEDTPVQTGKQSPCFVRYSIYGTDINTKKYIKDKKHTSEIDNTDDYYAKGITKFYNGYVYKIGDKYTTKWPWYKYDPYVSESVNFDEFEDWEEEDDNYESLNIKDFQPFHVYVIKLKLVNDPEYYENLYKDWPGYDYLMSHRSPVNNVLMQNRIKEGSDHFYLFVKIYDNQSGYYEGKSFLYDKKAYAYEWSMDKYVDPIWSENTRYEKIEIDLT